MNYTRLLTAAALVSCIVLPSAARAQSQYNPIGGGYGIFGTGSNLAGVYTGPNTSNFGRNYNYTPSQIGNFVQAAYTGSNVQPLGLFGLGANGAGGNSSILSPYLNLLRPGSAAVNYYSGVRPALRQNAINGDWATNFKQAEKIGEEELRARQGLENALVNVDWSQGYKQAEQEGEKEARRRAGENPEPEFRDWATSYKDQEIQGEAKAEKDRMKSKQRAANLRQAKELKELEAELSAGGPADQSKVIAPPSLAAGLQSYHGPGYASQFRSMTHFYPSQGLPIGRIGGH